MEKENRTRIKQTEMNINYLLEMIHIFDLIFIKLLYKLQKKLHLTFLIQSDMIS